MWSGVCLSEAKQERTLWMRRIWGRQECPARLARVACEGQYGDGRLMDYIWKQRPPPPAKFEDGSGKWEEGRLQFFHPSVTFHHVAPNFIPRSVGRTDPQQQNRVRVCVEGTLIRDVSESETESILLCGGDHWNKLEFGIKGPVLLLFDNLTMQAELKGVGFFSFPELSRVQHNTHMPRWTLNEPACSCSH